jgi:uncharacterized membrane protein YqgA involved in biofilm formation
MIAVFINCGAIIFGSLLGLLFAKKITDSITTVVTGAAGLVTLVLGFQMAFGYTNIIYVTISLMIGGLLGTKWDIEGKILLFGKFLERKLYIEKKNEGNKSTPFAFAFLNASVLFCVGAMAIVGSFKAGIEGDYTIIFTKSVLDGFMAIVFTSAMGIGTAFSAISIFIYQGLLTLASKWVAPYVSELMISEVSAVGGILIIMIGINLLDIKKLKTANYLPAIILMVLFVLADPFIKQFVTF